MGTQETKEPAICDDYMLLSSALCGYQSWTPQVKCENRSRRPPVSDSIFSFHRYGSMTIFLYARRVSLITQTMPFPLSTIQTLKYM
jgi:hypothetical protein